jgi:hypothetical protein
MTAFAATRTLRRYIDRDKRDDVKRLKDALYEGGTVGMQALGQIYQLPDFVCEGTTDSNTAAASSPVISLSDEGVSFAANTYRDIIVETFAANGSNCYRFKTMQRILGGADPTSKGPEQFLTDCWAHYGFTTSDGTTTTEDATACIAPAWWDGASPVAGDVSSNKITIQWLGTNSPVRVLLPGDVQNFDAAAIVGDSRVYQHGNVSLTNGTSDVTVSDNAATPALANWTSGSVVRINAKILPPVWTPVLIDTASSPDEVFIGAQGISSDLVTWVIRIWVSDPITLPLL